MVGGSMINESKKILSHDSNGNPIPYSFIPLDLTDIHFNLVERIPESKTRGVIFNGYQNYCKDIHMVVKNEIEQWIDGSFTTTKTDPNDIDIVNCIHVKDLDSLKDRIFPFLTDKGTPKLSYHVDGYLLPLCDNGDPRYMYFYSKYVYWEKWFGRDRQNNKKGIVKTKVAEL